MEGEYVSIIEDRAKEIENLKLSQRASPQRAHNLQEEKIMSTKREKQLRA